MHEAFLERADERNMSDKVSDKLTEKEKNFLKMLVKQLTVDEYLTTASMAEITGIPASTVRRYMTKFCELGVLYSEGKNKGKRYYLSKV